ncbi:hypothetical protein TMEC54S_02027 [Thauera mechernichensis]
MSLNPPVQLQIDRPHALEADAVLDQLGARGKGLSNAEAARRLAEVGPNRLPRPPRTGCSSASSSTSTTSSSTS